MQPNTPGGATARVLPFERFSGTRLSKAQQNEARLFALVILRDPEYQRNLLAAARKRELPPAVETAIMAYGWGKPPDKVEVGKPGEFSELEDLSAEDLAQRAEALASVLRSKPTPEEITEAVRSTDAVLPEAPA